MTRRRELSEFRKRLLGWFRQFQRDLPWRRDRDPYRIWLSEIMLQQTRVAAVLPFYERFLTRFPDIRTLAEAPEEQVLRLWSGLGYYSRARNLHSAAQQIVAMHGGKFPQTADEALTLPGIGSYSAAAILSIAFGGRYAVLDGNVARVIARLDAVRGGLREAGRWSALQNRADQLLEVKSAGDWNQAMMELGAVICTPRGPQCLVCPVAKFCQARQLGLTEVIPEKRKRRATVTVMLAAAVLVDGRGSTLLLAPPNALGKHGTHEEVVPLVSKMWHFPIVRVENDAVLELRGLLRELGVGGVAGSELRFNPLLRARHTVTYRVISLLPYMVPVRRLPRIAGSQAVMLSELVARASVAVSNLTRKIAQAALKGMAGA
jgi:A/G-specific adenine glycosylase